MKISRLLVNGLDVRIEDHTVKPPLIVPLNNLDVDVRDLSSRPTVEDKPIRFTVLLNAGQVPLPKRDTHGAIGGALTDIAGLATGQNTKRTIGIEQRDLFSEIEASGKVSLYPKLKGWIKSSVSGLELVAFKGNAAEQGIILEAGTFDQSVDIRFPGDGSMEALPHFVVTDLEVSEPPNGPIVHYLHLPAPLDAVLAVLRDKDGSITVPLHVKVHDAKNFDELVSKAEQDSINAFDAIVVTALANAPSQGGWRRRRYLRPEKRPGKANRHHVCAGRRDARSGRPAGHGAESRNDYARIRHLRLSSITTSPSAMRRSRHSQPVAG